MIDSHVVIMAINWLIDDEISSHLKRIAESQCSAYIWLTISSLKLSTISWLNDKQYVHSWCLFRRYAYEIQSNKMFKVLVDSQQIIRICCFLFNWMTQYRYQQHFNKELTYDLTDELWFVKNKLANRLPFSLVFSVTKQVT